MDSGITQKQVAKHLGVDETTVYNWEKHRTEPGLRHLPSLARLIGYVSEDTWCSLAEKLRRKRRSLGLSQKKLAKLLKVDESSIWSWEAGRRRPKGVYLKLIATFMKTI